MNKRQDAKITMFKLVQATIAKYIAILNPVINFIGYNTSFNTFLTNLLSLTEQQIYSIVGNKIDKKAVRTTLIQLILESCSRLKAYCIYNNNNVLLKESNFNLSTLKRLSDNEFRDTAQAIYDSVQANLVALASYGSNTTTQLSFQNTINAYNSVLTKPKLARTTQKMITLKIDDMVKQTEGALKKIDTVVDMLRFSQPDLYKEYKMTRRIGKVGVRHNAVKAKVTESITGETIAEVKVVFTLDQTSHNYISSTKPIKKKSSKKGGFNIDNMPDGIYQLTAKKDGYKDTQIAVVVNEGELTRITIEMVKLDLV